MASAAALTAYGNYTFFHCFASFPKIFFQDSHTVIKEITPDSPSLKGPAQRTPSTPIKYPKISIAGIKKIICRDNESSVAGTGLPMAWKKIPVTAPAGIRKHASK